MCCSSFLSHCLSMRLFHLRRNFCLSLNLFFDLAASVVELIVLLTFTRRSAVAVVATHALEFFHESLLLLLAFLLELLVRFHCRAIIESLRVSKILEFPEGNLETSTWNLDIECLFEERFVCC